MRGSCKRAESECRFAHPQESVTAHEDNSVTVCMDAVKSRCARESCRYFHPPMHLQAQIKAAQSRATAVWLSYFLIPNNNNCLQPPLKPSSVVVVVLFRWLAVFAKTLTPTGREIARFSKLTAANHHPQKRNTLRICKSLKAEIAIGENSWTYFWFFCSSFLIYDALL